MSITESRPSTPPAALRELLAGNHRFVTDTRIHPHQDVERRATLATGQQPFAVVFGCSDSRLSAEIIFDQGLGDLFVVRTAGNVIGPQVLASIEFGVAVLAAPLIVVLGHDSCGGVRAAADAAAGTAPAPGLRPIVDEVTPSVRAAHDQGVRDLDQIGELHVRRVAERLRAPGTELAAAVAAGRCAVVGMSYRLAEGRVAVVTPEPLG